MPGPKPVGPGGEPVGPGGIPVGPALPPLVDLGPIKIISDVHEINRSFVVDSVVGRVCVDDSIIDQRIEDDGVI